MKIKHLIALFALGIFFDIIGALFKIQHWPYGSELLIISTLLKVVAVILFIWKILTTKKGKEFLNW